MSMTSLKQRRFLAISGIVYATLPRLQTREIFKELRHQEYERIRMLKSRTLIDLDLI